MQFLIPPLGIAYLCCLVDQTFAITLPSLTIIYQSRLPQMFQTSPTGRLSAADSGISNYDLTLKYFGSQPICDGATFGHDISRSSCNDALSQMRVVRGNPIRHYGQRGHWSAYHNKLPIRWLSCKQITMSCFCA